MDDKGKLGAAIATKLKTNLQLFRGWEMIGKQADLIGMCKETSGGEREKVEAAVKSLGGGGSDEMIGGD